MDHSQNGSESMMKTKQYVYLMEQLVKKIEETKPKDRLEYSVATAFLLNSLLSSIKGWEQWMNSLESINSLNLADWKEIYPKMVKLSTNWLKLDLHITKKKLVETSLKLKELRKKLKNRKPVKRKKTSYVA